MRNLIKGLERFRSGVETDQSELFDRLSKGQSPETLFITCSDSRICPNLMTQTGPGELFILRNAGNIIPPYGAFEGGTGATIEFAVVGLGVRDIIVCGHTDCGAIKGLMEPERLQKLPHMSKWLSNAEATREIMQTAYADISEPSAKIQIATQENVLVQIENLQTHPCVAARLLTGKLKLHAWMYKIQTGEVFSYSKNTSQYELLTEASVDLSQDRRPPIAISI